MAVVERAGSQILVSPTVLAQLPGCLLPYACAVKWLRERGLRPQAGGL